MPPTLSECCVLIHPESYHRISKNFFIVSWGIKRGVHPLGMVNTCTKFQCNPPSSCWDISVWKNKLTFPFLIGFYLHANFPIFFQIKLFSEFPELDTEAQFLNPQILSLNKPLSSLTPAIICWCCFMAFNWSKLFLVSLNGYGNMTAGAPELSWSI